MDIKLNCHEKEILILKAIIEMINNMVNYEIFDLSVNFCYSEIKFKSTTHQSFFNILLVDFLSIPSSEIFKSDNSYLLALKKICGNPNFNQNNSISTLELTMNSFNGWLNQEVEIEKIWFPSLNKEFNLKLKRIEFINICGNISKHNFTRLTGISKKIQNIFKNNELFLNESDGLLILKEFYDHFHNKIFNYHSSTIAEFLNNIRWGIYEYLQPLWHKSIVWESHNPPKYKYIYPKNVENIFAKNYYWDLMNDVRMPPCVPRFIVDPILKKRY